jgi:single-strand DNA-binding protein
MNKLILIGNLVRDPELKNVSGSDLVNGSIATTYKYKSGNETKEEVCYVDFVIWGKRAVPFSQYTSKGKKVMLEGRLQTKSWESAEGKKISKLVLNVENFEFLSPQGQGQSSQPEPEYTPSYGDDDIPF